MFDCCDAQMLASLLPSTAFALTVIRAASFESTAQGATAANRATVIRNFAVLDGFGMMMIDVAVYLTLTWYLDNVLSSEFGVKRPFYFPFTKREGLQSIVSRVFAVSNCF
jgi:hypothetical protein